MEMNVVLLVVVAFYWTLSCILTWYPHLLHTKKPDTLMRNVRHISHRGGSTERPENTLEAFRRAFEIGTDMFELDVHLTKDNKVVVTHDPNLKRLTGVDKLVKDLDYSELPKYKKDIGVTFSPGFRLDTSAYDTRIPLLEEIFEEFPNVPVNIDLKGGSADTVDEVYKIIKKYNKDSTVVWGSFIQSTCNLCHQKAPHIPLVFSAKRVFSVTIMYYLGLLAFLPIRESFFEIPMFLSFPGLPLKFRPLIWLVRAVLGSPRMFRYLNKRGVMVFVWVQNSTEDFHYCYVQKKANGIMTDCPTLLKEFFAQLDQRHQKNL